MYAFLKIQKLLPNNAIVLENPNETEQMTVPTLARVKG
jgi:hypothetical protein